MPTHRPPAPIALTAALLAAATLTGCAFLKPAFSRTPGGNSRSDDTYTYVSTPYEPLTITLYDNRDNEPLWTVDVPIDSKLSIRFRENKIKEGTPRRPDIMDWVIYDADDRWERFQNSMAVPPARARLLRVALREGPEYAPEPIEDKTFPEPERSWVPTESKTYRDDAGD